MLEARKIGVNYDEREAVTDVSLRADAGKLIAVIGPNGAGKSTVLRALNGSVTVNRGEVLLDERRIDSYARRAVALHDVPGVKGTPFEDRGNATLNLAASLVLRRQPEPEEAARLCIETIAVPEAQRTETVRKRAVELRRLLGHWRTIPAVKDFADELHGYELPASNP